MTTLHGKTVLLTGASGAIGSLAALRLAAAGAQLALVGRRRGELETVAAEATAVGAPPPVVLQADLSRAGAAADLAQRAEAALGGVDVLVNNAGGSLQGLSWVVGDHPEARAVLETNLWAPLALAQALAPGMVARGDGVIVNVGSMARVSPFPHLGHYAASRAALSVATDVMRLELRPRGVRVVEVAFGAIDTPASQENRSLAGAGAWLDGRPGLGRPEDAAQALADAVTSDADIVFHPAVLRWPARFPSLGRRYTRRVAKGADLADETVRVGGVPQAGR
ncbi:MAG: SDR family NAD(P)-dependent oxidoreductase [Solirubrobacteraceae bacterium]|nr:SDR family NAD(P)-dependent oxidoreductase [Solirubrobacteraceae bacterium]